jgi:hypothetical protein
MAEPDDDLTRSVAAVLTEPGGGILVDLVTTDYESFHSVLTPIPDIASPESNAESEEAYAGPFWLIDIDRAANGALYACDGDGNVHTNRSGVWTVEPVSPGKGLRVVCALPDGTVLTAGTEGVVYRRGAEAWTAISPSFGQWITGMGGRTGRDLAVCGDNGLVAVLSGDTWTTPMLPTDATLNALIAVGEEFLAGGQNGTLFRGNAEAWADLSGSGHDIHGLAVREGMVWAACGSAGAATLAEDGAIEVVRDTFAAFCVHSAGPHIVFAGNLTVARFDGATWKGRRYNA